ncbi:DUF3732 domain-containing protein [Dyella sp. GSA-30]|uniref:DUF3732 domain-containing protein n=1 Tax=Dyella sp. GSA-30 TaxID=2994496 RepID=UPI0024937EEA|nr:DUF3732 domain-containing protein [Dyella sp. GSA-30]BDU22234.1 hypothetical protein DYGSA30_36910 [Dyella sp. GSA-30]
MYFQILKLVLWPRKGGEPRVVPFERNVVNVISGGSKTGKSAVIPIIDYCLGSEHCAIPVGKIRQACNWFGVVVDTSDGEILFARREPGDVRRQGDFFVLQDTTISVPHTIADKSHSREEVKELLNRLSGLSNLRFEADPDVGYKARVGFRDLMAFVFQPQNIVANPDVLFFKADTTEHRERLKTILPYVLGAVTPRTLAARQELVQVQRQLKRLSADLRSIESTADRWAADGRSWLQQAIELGLARESRIPDSWPEILHQLRAIANVTHPSVAPTVRGAESTIRRIASLREEVRRLSSEATDHRQRLAEIHQLTESSNQFGGALELQRERLALSTWLRDRFEEQDTPFERRAADSALIERLCSALGSIELQVRTQPMVRNTLDKEEIERKAALGAALERLAGAKKELAVYERSTAEAKAAGDRLAFAERFLGKLEQAISQYDDADHTQPLRNEIAALSAREVALRYEIDDQSIRRKLDQALDEIERLTGRLVPDLDGEWKTSPVRLNIQELSVEVDREGRKHFLWEIGSGANWLAYHIAITVALQQFFARKPHHEVPGLLVYDQPSQVYFPKRASETDDDNSDDGGVDWRDEDIEAVRAVFALLGRVVTDAKAPLQVIVLDHADGEVWGDLPGVQLCDRWRDGEKLVPVAWLEED